MMGLFLGRTVAFTFAVCLEQRQQPLNTSKQTNVRIILAGILTQKYHSFTAVTFNCSARDDVYNAYRGSICTAFPVHAVESCTCAHRLNC